MRKDVIDIISVILSRIIVAWIFILSVFIGLILPAFLIYKLIVWMA